MLNFGNYNKEFDNFRHTKPNMYDIIKMLKIYYKGVIIWIQRIV